VFGTISVRWTFELEHEVQTLGEPRPTSIDVLMQRNEYRIAVECKFAQHQGDIAVAACRHPGLLRKVSWQTVLAATVEDDVLSSVMAKIRVKYFNGIAARERSN
jgi:hypothetical protein